MTQIEHRPSYPHSPADHNKLFGWRCIKSHPSGDNKPSHEDPRGFGGNGSTVMFRERDDQKKELEKETDKINMELIDGLNLGGNRAYIALLSATRKLV